MTDLIIYYLDGVFNIGFINMINNIEISCYLKLNYVFTKEFLIIIIPILQCHQNKILRQSGNNFESKPIKGNFGFISQIVCHFVRLQ